MEIEKWKIKSGLTICDAHGEPAGRKEAKCLELMEREKVVGWKAGKIAPER